MKENIKYYKPYSILKDFPKSFIKTLLNKKVMIQYIIEFLWSI